MTCTSSLLRVLVLSFPFDRVTQPVVLEEREGESEAQVDARLPTVYMIGSRVCMAMFANTLTAASRLLQDDGTYAPVGRQYRSLLNAK